MSASGFFITGTDTECGKTEISLGLMYLIKAGGRTVQGLKPVASGAKRTASGLRNSDALRLQELASETMPYALVNPYVFGPAIAPHLAAQAAGVEIDFDRILESYRKLKQRTDLVIVEGVGGWLVPLRNSTNLSELAVALGLPVILVVGLKLGCINHALLTRDSIRKSGLRLAGWVANTIDPNMLEIEGNICTLNQRITEPCLGVVPHLRKPTPKIIANKLCLPENLSSTIRRADWCATKNCG